MTEVEIIKEKVPYLTRIKILGQGAYGVAFRAWSKRHGDFIVAKLTNDKGEYESSKIYLKRKDKTKMPNLAEIYKTFSLYGEMGESYNYLILREYIPYGVDRKISRKIDRHENTYGTNRRLLTKIYESLKSVTRRSLHDSMDCLYDAHTLNLGYRKREHVGKVGKLVYFDVSTNHG